MIFPKTKKSNKKLKERKKGKDDFHKTKKNIQQKIERKKRKKERER